MKTYSQFLSETLEHSERERAFSGLANMQRGKPEEAMMQLQWANGGGVLSHAVEHGGDLTHRMSEPATAYNRGYEHVKEKVEALDRRLNNPYGFEREHIQNIKANAEYTKTHVGKYNDKVKLRGKVYADEHSKLPVYNDMQHHAKHFAVALGNQDFEKAKKHLAVIKAVVDQGEKTWTKHANKFDPNYESINESVNLLEKDHCFNEYGAWGTIGDKGIESGNKHKWADNHEDLHGSGKGTEDYVDYFHDKTTNELNIRTHSTAGLSRAIEHFNLLPHGKDGQVNHDHHDGVKDFNTIPWHFPKVINSHQGKRWKVLSDMKKLRDKLETE